MDKKKILIVDDEKDVAYVLGKRLEAAGYTVFSAETGKDAIISAKSNRFDLIILDVALPDMLGGEVAATFKKIPETRGIPIIFLSAMFSKAEETKRGHKIGENLMFAKPYEVEELLVAVSELLGPAQQPKMPSPELPARQPKILLVDDEKDLLRTMSLKLKKHGYDVIFAMDGFSAISTAINEKPDLVLLDIGLPAGDGFSVMQKINSNCRTILMPIIVITGRELEENKKLAMEAGAKAFFQKPVDTNNLLTAIQSVLEESTASL